MIKSCHICFDTNVDDNFICDRCGYHYCEKCSYTYSIHFEYQGSLCFKCSSQNRRTKLDYDLVDKNKIKLEVIIRESKFNNLLAE